MTLLLAVLAAVAGTTQDEDIPAEVRVILQRHFGKKVDPEKMEACATTISTAISGARPAKWGQSVLQHLRGAAEFARLRAHQFSLLEELEQNIPPAVQLSIPRLPPALLKEGLHLQLDYLALQVDRVTRTPWTDERRKQSLEQIDQLAAAMKTALFEKLPGKDGAAFVSRTVNNLHQDWKDSLDLPFNRLIDQPLSAAEFKRIVDGIRAAARPFVEVTLTAQDLTDIPRLNELKVNHLTFEVQEAAFKICAACFSEYGSMEDKIKVWDQKAEKAMEGSALSPRLKK